MTNKDLIPGCVYHIHFPKVNFTIITKWINDVKVGPGIEGASLSEFRSKDSTWNWSKHEARLVTPDEGRWFEACIKANKFIPKEEVMKQTENKNTPGSLIGRYLKCISSPYGLVPLGCIHKIVEHKDCVNTVDILSGRKDTWSKAKWEGPDPNFELMPEGFEPGKNTEVSGAKFEVGKWYQDGIKHYYGKLTGPIINNFPSKEYIALGKYCNTGSYFSKYYFLGGREVPLSEIQQYLPEGHPDKIKIETGTWVPKVGTWVYKQKGERTGEVHKIESVETNDFRTTMGIYTISGEIYRKALPHEIPGASVMSQDKPDSKEALLAEAKRRGFVPGVTYKCVHNNETYSKEKTSTISENYSNISYHPKNGSPWGLYSDKNHWLMMEGTWAEIVSKPENNRGPVIIRTEDGKELYAGDIYWYKSKRGFVIQGPETIHSSVTPDKVCYTDYWFFSTKIAAKAHPPGMNQKFFQIELKQESFSGKKSRFTVTSEPETKVKLLKSIKFLKIK